MKYKSSSSRHHHHHRRGGIGSSGDDDDDEEDEDEDYYDGVDQRAARMEKIQKLKLVDPATLSRKDKKILAR